MTTMAQSILDLNTNKVRRKMNYLSDTEIILSAKRRLSLPDKSTVAEGMRCAQRIVFRDNLHIVSIELNKTGQVTVEAAKKFVKLPKINLWMEWPALLDSEDRSTTDFTGKMGILMVPLDGYHGFSIFHQSNKDNPDPILVGKLFSWKEEAIHSLELMWHGYSNDEIALVEAKKNLCTAMYGLVLSAIPRAYDIALCRPSEKLNRNRAKRNRPPIIDFHEIKLKMSVKPRRFERTEQLSLDSKPSGIEMPWHIVDPHFRTYWYGPRDSENRKAEIKWIEAFTRGNPKRGISIKQKEISA